MIDNKFSYWTVIDKAETRGHKKYWLCKCDCGTEREVRQDALTDSTSKSCGCMKGKLSHKHTKFWEGKS